MFEIGLKYEYIPNIYVYSQATPLQQVGLLISTRQLKQHQHKFGTCTKFEYIFNSSIFPSKLILNWQFHMMIYYFRL